MKFILKLVVFVFLFQNHTAFCQNHEILYRILNDTLIMDPRSPIVELKFELINKSDKDYILYNYSEIESRSADMKNIQKLNVVLGNELYILQGYKERFGGEPIDSFHRFEDEPFDSFDDSLYNESTDPFTAFQSFLKTTSILLRRGTTVKLKRQINLQYFELEPWEYKLSLVYYSGKNISTYFTEEEISTEEKEYGATFFRGWVQSNSVPLIVRYER